MAALWGYAKDYGVIAQMFSPNHMSTHFRKLLTFCPMMLIFFYNYKYNEYFVSNISAMYGHIPFSHDFCH